MGGASVLESVASCLRDLYPRWWHAQSPEVALPYLHMRPIRPKLRPKSGWFIQVSQLGLQILNNNSRKFGTPLRWNPLLHTSLFSWGWCSKRMEATWPNERNQSDRKLVELQSFEGGSTSCPWPSERNMSTLSRFTAFILPWFLQDKDWRPTTYF